MMGSRAIEIGERVYADGDDTLKMVVTAYTVRSDRRMIECSYFFDGRSQAAWVEDWRLTVVR